MNASSTLPPLFTGRIIDGLQNLHISAATLQLGFYVLVTIAAGAIGFGSNYASCIFRETLARNLRVTLMEKLQRAHLEAATALTLGEIANRLSGDIDTLCVKLEFALFPTLQGLCALVATAGMMLVLDLRLALVAFGVVLLGIIPMKLATPRLVELQKRGAKNEDDLLGTVNETANLSALALLKNVLAAKRELDRYRALAERAFGIKISQTLVGGSAGFLAMLVNVAGPAAILGTGMYLLLRHEISVGLIVAFLLYQSRLYSPFAGLTVLPMQIANIGVLAGRLLEIVDLREEESGSQPFRAGPICLSDIEVRRERRAIVEGFSLSIPRGTHAAIVGPSGAGKSTIASLLLRLHDPYGGSVSISGCDLRDIRLNELRACVALVSQEPLIFDTTLLENLTYTNPQAGADAVREAIGLCRLTEVVQRLPEGLQTRLGQRGFRLSGGERQRICLARAVIQDAQILLLDEALTGVDVEMESRIFMDLRDRFESKTLLVITHRLASIVDFDEIAVMDNGSLRAHGTHADVRSACEWYDQTFQTTQLDVAVPA